MITPLGYFCGCKMLIVVSNLVVPVALFCCAAQYPVIGAGHNVREWIFSLLIMYHEPWAGELLRRLYVKNQSAQWVEFALFCAAQPARPYPGAIDYYLARHVIVIQRTDLARLDGADLSS